MEQEIKLLKTRIALLQKLLNVQKNIQREIGNFGYKIFMTILLLNMKTKPFIFIVQNGVNLSNFLRRPAPSLEILNS